ncbi:hypothetical protein [Apilactobacillus ozensis]|uniref:hypothetical protein n=1 Tax=Apilactobacillus ozensis TaxID=866801 RepID=UPI00200AE411|nr:hypothetical protein [Apilactobacillus ozensis]MCK8607201.1 hypothetical protein [Apilactobacillus ozensis]
MIEKMKSHPLTNVGSVLAIFLVTIIFSNLPGLDGPTPELGFSLGRLFDGAHEVFLVVLLYIVASLFKNKFVLLFIYGFELIRISYFVTLGIAVLKSFVLSWAFIYFFIGFIMLMSNYLLYTYVYEIIKLKENQAGSFAKRWQYAAVHAFSNYRLWLILTLMIYFMSVVIL